MNDNTKRTLITVGAILSLCCFIGLMASVVLFGLGKEVDRRINIGPASSPQAQENIATVEMPAGYQLTSGMSMLVFDMVSFSPTENKALPTIMLVQFHEYTSINPSEMNIQYGSDSFSVVDTFQATIRGQETTITVSEDARRRQWTGFFEGNFGPAIFVAEGPISGWDDQLLMHFLKSIQ